MLSRYLKLTATPSPPRFIKKFCEPDPANHRLLEKVTDRLGLSARSYTRILRGKGTPLISQVSNNEFPHS